jgi:PAS domain S-box-containing protein
MTAADAEIARLNARILALEAALNAPPSVEPALHAAHTMALEKLAALEARYRRLAETTRDGLCTCDARSQGALVRRDGTDAWIRRESTPIVDEGSHEGVIGSAVDVTERRRIEDLLRESEIQLRQAQELAQVGSWEWDLGTDLITRSAGFCRILGIEPAELGCTRPQSYDHLHPDDRERVRAALAHALATRTFYSAEYRIVRADGTRFLHARGQVLSDRNGEPTRFLGTVQDVTDRKRLDARLLIADRMASLGTLAAGVAHEINNPLAFVISNLDLVTDEIRAMEARGPSEQHRELTTMIGAAREGAERVRRIVRGLKAFSRADDERRARLDVHQVLDGAIGMAFNEIRHRAKLIKNYGEVPRVFADEPRLAQVFLNLLINAAQALPEGESDRNEIRVTTRTDASGRALIEVRDTGCGMSEEVLSHVFDPFFTTKPVGVGTGLGLSICHGIIEALGGEITVESEQGKGTTFRVALPPAEVGEASVAPPPRKVSTPIGARLRVLVVDDEPMVGASLRRILKGHDVTVLSDAREARDLVAAGERYDLILCDLMMPHLSGMDLHATLARTTPDQAERMVFVTGGAFSPNAVAFLDRVPNERIDKPFDHGDIRALAQRFRR